MSRTDDVAPIYSIRRNHFAAVIGGNLFIYSERRIRNCLFHLIIRILIPKNAERHIIFSVVVHHERTLVDVALAGLLGNIAVNAGLHIVISGIGEHSHRRIIGRKPILHFHAVNEGTFAVIVIVAEI